MFTKDVSTLDSIPESSILLINKILENGKLFRYSSLNPEDSYVSLLEKKFAEYMWSKYALAVNSCSSAIFLSMVSLWIWEGDEVIIPWFTFTAVPSSVIHAWAIPVIVECKENYCLDVADFKRKITKNTKALLISYMRWHFDDLEEIEQICKENNIHMIEDCANALGSDWNWKKVGKFGITWCFSFQSYKLMNGGEWWMLVTDDDELYSKALLLSWSYETMWKSHYMKPPFGKELQKIIPTYNLRMSHLTWAVLLPQVEEIDLRAKKYNLRHQKLIDMLSWHKYIHIPKRWVWANYVAETLQFTLKDLNLDDIRIFITKINSMWIWVRSFGADPDNMRCFWNWQYIKDLPELPNTRSLLLNTCEVRLPLSFSMDDIEDMWNIIIHTLNNL